MRRDPADSFLGAARERIIIFDGGLGTALRRLGAPAGACHELLVETQPDIVYQAHVGFLRAGAEVIETDTFGGSVHTLAEHGLESRCLELNRKAAELARKAVREYGTPARPRYVAGSIGPGTKLPSLGQIGVSELKAGYMPQIEGLLAGGVDCLIVETCQDLLQMRAALVAIEETFERIGRRVPVIAQVTIDARGRMLAGSDITAVLATLDPFPVAAIGLNCGLGPDGMTAELRYLAEHSSRLVSVMPNAGMPRLGGGAPVYDLSPEDFARQMRAFAQGPGLNIAGGCCGTGPEHIRALARALHGLPPRKSAPAGSRISCLFSAQDLRVSPRPLLCGERTNASGSKKFRDLLLARDLSGMVKVASDQQKEGAHLTDLSVAAAGKDEVADMAELCRRLNTVLELPVMIDSTNPAAAEAALENLAGRCIVNSVNLENPDRARKTIELCRRHGAALVLMTIDSRGMAMTAERKLDVAEMLYDLAVRRGGLGPESVFFDFLTFTLASGDESLAESAAETLKAIVTAKKRFPKSLTLLGVSNVSYGLEPQARRALNTIFLNRAIEHGLDAAILHAGRIEPLAELEPEAVQVCDDLIFNRHAGGERPLDRLVNWFSRHREKPVTKAQMEHVPPDERLRELVLTGDSDGATKAVIELAEQHRASDARNPPALGALAIIEDILLPAMAEVGRLFEQGKLQLPFVLRSAEAVRDCLDLLGPQLGHKQAGYRGIMVIATVRGDIHDIGKNLVGTVLAGNGFRVVNLGVRKTAEEVIAAVREHRPEAIGLSGLLVESARAMKEYVETFKAAGISTPVICGGAALTREYVEQELQPAYSGRVYYAKDAMAGLKIMQDLTGQPAARQVARQGASTGAQDTSAAPRLGRGCPAAGRGRQTIGTGPDAVSPPLFRATKTVRVAIDRIAPRLDKDALFCKRWQMVGSTALLRGSPRESGIRNPSLRSRNSARLREAQNTLDEMLHARGRSGTWHGAIVCALLAARVEDEHLLLLHPGTRVELARLRFSPTFLGRIQGRGRRQRASGSTFPVALQVVTMGSKVVEECRRLAEEGRVTDQFLLHGLTAELTEALAEYGQHTAIPKMPGWSRTVRYSPGYPVWPDLSEQRKVFALLRPERIGVTLTEGYQMVPEYSTSAIIMPGPQTGPLALA